MADASQDAVITDPPFYDNISYADLSDFFYVWLKRSVGFLYPDHLGGELTRSETRRSWLLIGTVARRARRGRSTSK